MSNVKTVLWPEMNQSKEMNVMYKAEGAFKQERNKGNFYLFRRDLFAKKWKML